MTRQEKRRVTSSYRREFSPERSAKVPSARKSLCENLQYREQRRQIEHIHQASPFIWDDWAYELNDEDDDTVVENERLQCSAIPKNGHQTVEEKSPSCSSISSKVGGSRKLSNASAGSSSRRINRKYAQEKPKVSLPCDQPNSRVVREHSCTSSSSSCDCGESPLKARGVSKRVLSDTISKSQKKSNKYPAKCITRQSAPIDSPFIPYGTGDDEMETGNKRTHNTLCHDQVYKSAEYAKARQEAARTISKQRLEQRTAETRTRRPKTAMFDPRFDENMNKHTRDWRSEYGIKYNKYNTTEYRHNLDHKPPY